MTYLLIVSVALLLLALALWKGKKRSHLPKRTERLTIDHKLVTTNTKMKGIGA